MRLSDSGLYTLVSESGGFGAASFAVRLNSGHPIVLAHFPGFPVTPGAVLVQIALELSESVIGRPARLSEARSVKFLAPVSPDSDIVFELASSVLPDSRISLDVIVRKAHVSPSEIHSKMTLILH